MTWENINDSFPICEFVEGHTQTHEQKQGLSNTYILYKYWSPRQAQGTVEQHNPINHPTALQEVFQVIPPENEDIKYTKAL